MSAQQYDTVDLLLDENVKCGSTKATTSFIWECTAGFHGDNKHYFVRAI